MGEERIRPTRSGLFMIELLIAVGVFTLCAAVCVGLFVRAEVMSRESADLTRMTTEARNVVECWKASGGDLGRTIELADAGRVVDGALFQPYDGDWNRMVGSNLFDDAAEIPAFYLTLEPRQESGYTAGILTVTRNGETKPMLQWDLATLEVTP